MPGRGIYLNVPDWYFLSGSSKTRMGYGRPTGRCPRERQVIIEPAEHLRRDVGEDAEHGLDVRAARPSTTAGAQAATHRAAGRASRRTTRAHLGKHFGAGVQACYRGPRLYDTEATRTVVKKWVAFYKAHRAILDSDVIHLRQADGRDWTGSSTSARATRRAAWPSIHNPLDVDIVRKSDCRSTTPVLTEAALVRGEDGGGAGSAASRDSGIATRVKVPARGRTWLAIEGAMSLLLFLATLPSLYWAQPVGDGARP